MKGFKKFLTLPAIGFAAFFASCSEMHEDLEDCPYGLYVRFVYDYNTLRADMFPDHVGHLRLHVYDENGMKVAEKVISNSDLEKPLDSHGFTIYFPNSELAPGHSYRLQAVAMQKDWDSALATKGAKYRRAEGELPGDHHITLDHDAPRTPSPQCTHYKVSNEAPLDTLWHTLKVTSSGPLDSRDDPGVKLTRAPYTIYPLDEQMVRVEKESYTYATVSMIRDTKHLNISLRQVDNPAQVSHDDYEVVIIDDNTHLDGNNELVEDQTVHYTPYEGWTTRFNSDGSVTTETRTIGDGPLTRVDGTRADDRDDALQRTAHYDMMFNRIMLPEDPSLGGRLIVRNKRTGKNVIEMSLPHILSEGRTAYEIYNYSRQEYLDREHDYRLDFILKGDEWQSVYILINVLSWSHRIDNVVLGE